MSRLSPSIRTALNTATLWTPHLVTASGLLYAFLSLVEIFASNYRMALIWMTAGVISDAIDGTIARRLNSAKKLPSFDGTLLDAIVDYITYVMVPVIFIYKAQLIPVDYNNWLLPAILIASAYQFAQSESKTHDNFFTGFPSYWNVAVLYILLLDPSHTSNLILLTVLTALIFVPIKYYYPSRTTKHKTLIMSVAIIWGISGFSLIFTYPTVYPIPLGISIICSTYYIAISIFTTLYSTPNT